MPQQKNSPLQITECLKTDKKEDDSTQSRDECHSIKSILSPLLHPAIDTHADLRTHS